MLSRLCFSLLTCGSLLCADTLVFKRGGSVDGQFLGGDQRTVRFLVGNQVNAYNLSDVVSIRFNSAGEPTASAGPYPPATAPYPPATPYPPSNYPSSNYPSSSYPQSGSSSNYPASQGPTMYPPPSADSSPTAQNAPAPPAPPNPYGTPAPTSAPTGPAGPGTAPLGIEVPPDTPVTVRMIDPVNSTTDSLGKTYRATVDEPVLINGTTAIPRGSDVVVALVASQQAGKVEGQTQLTLALKNVTVNGLTYDVKSSRVTQAAASRSRRSAEMIGGGAALGAVIGAIAGGGKGAAIGTVAGAGAGTAAAVATTGATVKVPSETRLVFTLQNPLDL